MREWNRYILTWLPRSCVHHGKKWSWSGNQVMPPPPKAAWVHGLLLSLSSEGHRQSLGSPPVLICQDTLLFMELSFYYPPKRHWFQRTWITASANEPSVAFCWKAWKLLKQYLGWNKETAGKARLCWLQPVKSIHLARGVTVSDPL